MNAQLEQQIQADFPFMKLNKIDERKIYIVAGGAIAMTDGIT